jgi:cysteine synthase A
MTSKLPQNTSPASPGFGVRTSSYARIVAALRTAVELGPESRVVTILCDRAERYYSTKLFAN